jgi:alpha-aminoadipic semialdehyde synthase
LLENAAPFNDAWCDLQLECLPNRDSLIYETVYGIDGADSIFRGTLRYAGFSSLLQVFRNMGFFGLQHFEAASTWEDIIRELQRIRGHEGALQDFVRICAGEDQELAQRAMVCLEWLRLTGRSDEVDHSNAVVDLFCARLEKHLRYEKGETDMVVMHHAISASFEDGSVEHHTSTLQTFGDESMTAMCRTVGYPTAAASDLILRGSLSGRNGLLLPTIKEIYLPVLDKLAKEGIVFKDRVKVAQAQNSNLAKA